MRLVPLSTAEFPDGSAVALLNVAETDFITRGSNGVFPNFWQEMVLAQQDWADETIAIYPNAERNYREYMTSLQRLDPSWVRFAPGPQEPKPFPEQRQEGMARMSTRTNSFSKVLAAAFATTNGAQEGLQKTLQAEIIPVTLTLKKIRFINRLAWLEIHPAPVDGELPQDYESAADIILENREDREATDPVNIAVMLHNTIGKYLKSYEAELRDIRRISQMLDDDKPEN